MDFFSSEELFPAVSFRKKDQSIRFNFGENEFLYSIQGYIKEVKEKISCEISKINIDFEKININFKKLNSVTNDFKDDEYNLIMDYLIYNVNKIESNFLIDFRDMKTPIKS